MLLHYLEKYMIWHLLVLKSNTLPSISNYCVTTAGGDNRPQLRSANRRLFAVPRYWLNTYSHLAFSAAGPTVWNSLPDFFRDPTISEDYFRHLLKTYLFAQY